MEVWESGCDGSVVRAFMFSFFVKQLHDRHTVVSDEVIHFVGLGKVKIAHDDNIHESLLAGRRAHPHTPTHSHTRPPVH